MDKSFVKFEEPRWTPLFVATAIIFSSLSATQATDFLFRYKMMGKVRSDLEDQGFKLNATGIIRAIREDNLAVFDQFDMAGVRYGATTSRGISPLHYAIIHKDQSAIDALLDRSTSVGKSVNHICEDGYTPLNRALERRNYELADQLLEIGADPDVEKSPGLPWLVYAITEEDISLRDYLLETGIDVNAKGSQPHTPMALASGTNDLALMKRLGALGADADVTGTTGMPLLHEVALESQHDEMAYILEMGVDPDQVHEDRKLLIMAIDKNDDVMREMLYEHGADVDRNGTSGRHLLFDAFHDRDPEWVQQILDRDISANLKDQEGQALLHLAAQRYDYAMVDRLIDNQADLNLPDSAGTTTLDRAIASGDTALARTLIEYGAEIDLTKQAEIAYTQRDHPTMHMLLTMGMAPNAELPNGKKLFDTAFADDNLIVSRTLLAFGGEIGPKFWQAMHNNQVGMVDLFLNYKQDPNQPSTYAQTPLDYALNKRQYGMVKPLLQAGARTSTMPSDGESWLGHLISTGDSELAMALLNAEIDLGSQRAGDGHSLLAWAIANDMTSVAIKLLDRGADPNIIEPAPATPDMLAKFKKLTRFQYYLKLDRKIRPVMMVAAKGQHSIAKALMDAGVKNYASHRNNYPIAIAAWSADVRMMQILFDRNPDFQPRKIVVNLSQQKVSFYKNGQLQFTTPCSSGKSSHPTKTGTFVVTQKNQFHRSNIYDTEMPYFMRLSCDDFGFHTGRLPGYPASSGCIRLLDNMASNLFYTCKLGDLVVIHH